MTMNNILTPKIPITEEDEMRNLLRRARAVIRNFTQSGISTEYPDPQKCYKDLSEYLYKYDKEIDRRADSVK